MHSGRCQTSSGKRIAKFKMKMLGRLILFGMCTSLISTAHAVKQGHARLLSAPGSPLEIALPISELTSEDLSALKVEVAKQALWTASGLTPPVPLDSLRVVLKPGARPDIRTITIQSSQPSTQSVVDILLTLATSSGSKPLQVSLLQPEFARVQLASGMTSVSVRPGDTLFGIAQRNLVSGATIHQMLWALYEANPRAFISENMNLLRAGSVLTIPDAKTVLAVDPAMARARFAEHDARFRSMRGQRAAVTGQPPVVGAASASAGKVSKNDKPADQAQPGENRLLLSTTNQDRESDLQASRKREIADHQARVGELEKNIQQMKDALGQSGGSVPASRADVQTGTASQSPSGASNASRSNPSGAASGSTVDASTTAANQSASPVSVSSGQQSAPKQGEMESSVATQWLKDHALAVLTALLAIVAFLIGMRMRRHSTRRDDESDDPDAAEQMSPAAKSAFEKKLQSIDLNLDSSDKPASDTKNPSQT